MDSLAFFHWVLVVAKLRLDPSCIRLDSEKAFTNAGKDQFHEVLTVGCFFIGSKQFADA